jgi:hypothetical protein
MLQGLNDYRLKIVINRLTALPKLFWWHSNLLNNFTFIKFFKEIQSGKVTLKIFFEHDATDI